MNQPAGPYLSKDKRDAVLELRRAMHRAPDLSNQEWRTQERIRAMLGRFGIDDTTAFHGTGLYVDIVGRAPGPRRSIAIRGDIDALPIQEDPGNTPYRSESPGVMHACGHDIHASIAYGAALAFHSMRDRFSGRLRVFFQPAEEAEPLGGRTVKDQHLLAGIDHAIGFHVEPDLPLATYAAEAGAVTSSSDEFRVTIRGTMAHGAQPHLGVDAIAIAAAFVNEVQKLVSRETSPDHSATVTIGRIQGGTAANIVCDEVVLEGTIRARSEADRNHLTRRVSEIAAGVAALHRGRADCVIAAGEPPVVNDADLVRRFQAHVCRAVGRDKVVHGKTVDGSDDFGFYSSCVPSLYFLFGTSEAGRTSGVHTPTFSASDDCLIPAAELTIGFCLELLR